MVNVECSYLFEMFQLSIVHRLNGIIGMLKTERYKGHKINNIFFFCYLYLQIKNVNIRNSSMKQNDYFLPFIVILTHFNQIINYLWILNLYLFSLWTFAVVGTVLSSMLATCWIPVLHLTITKLRLKIMICLSALAKWDPTNEYIPTICLWRFSVIQVILISMN